MMKLHKLLRYTQTQLFNCICQRFPQAMVALGEYIFVPGNIPLLLVAHMDTVHKEPVKQICTTNSGNIIMSPQGIGGDDRCGVYALLKLWKAVPDIHPSLLFTCDEEIGGVGAEAFTMDWEDGLYIGTEFKYIIELDRRGKNDAVFYNCDNPDFEDYIQSFGFKTDYGTYSDICTIAPVIGAAAVNLSCGYYNAHTTSEYIQLSHLSLTINKVKRMILDIDNSPVFPYYELQDYSLFYDTSHKAGMPCDICGRRVPVETLQFVEGDLLCEDCVKDFSYECGNCGRVVCCGNTRYIDGEHLCNDCYCRLHSAQ